MSVKYRFHHLHCPGGTIVFLLCAVLLRAPAVAAEPANPGTMDNFSLSGVNDKGTKSWDLQGRSADIGAEVISLKDVESHLYGDNSTVKLTADEGNYKRQQGQLHLEKDVVITTSSGAKLTTDSLDWDKRSKTVSTDDIVNIEKQDVRITGQGARGYSDLDKVDLEKDVRVNIDQPASPAQEEAPGRVSTQGRASAQTPSQTKSPGPVQNNAPVTITCDGPMQVDYQANIAVFNRNVVVKTGDCVMQSDVMVLLFAKSGEGARSADATDTRGSRIDRITATGNVVIRRGDNVSYSEEAVYTASDRKINLSGRPRLVIYSEDLNASARN